MNRERFPGLLGDWVRLDGPAGSQPVDSCIEAVRGYLAGPHVANLAAPSAASRVTQDIVDECRRLLAELLGGSPAGVVLGSSATALTARFATAFARDLSHGDEIICTALDHDANVSPWLRAAARAGARVRVARVDPRTLDLAAGAIGAMLGPRTRLVAVSAASNVTGAQPDLASIAAQVHASGAVLFVDAVHAIPHGPHEVMRCDADAVVCSAYKWFGPHVSAMRVRPDLLDRLDPEPIRPGLQRGPQAWEHGALPHELLPGLAAAARYLKEMDWVQARAHETELLEALLSGLQRIPRVRLLGDPARRTATVAFSIDGIDAERAASILAERRIAVNHGTFYAQELFGQIAAPSCLRAGALHYNTLQDVQALLEGVRSVCAGP